MSRIIFIILLVTAFALTESASAKPKRTTEYLCNNADNSISIEYSVSASGHQDVWFSLDGKIVFTKDYDETHIASFWTEKTKLGKMITIEILERDANNKPIVKNTSRVFSLVVPDILGLDPLEQEFSTIMLKSGFRRKGDQPYLFQINPEPEQLNCMAILR